MKLYILVYTFIYVAVMSPAVDVSLGMYCSVRKPISATGFCPNRSIVVADEKKVFSVLTSCLTPFVFERDELSLFCR